MSIRYYSARVADNDDPQHQGRLRLEVPAYTGPGVVPTRWIAPRLPAGAGPGAVGLWWVPPIDALVVVEVDAGGQGTMRWLGAELGQVNTLPEVFVTNYPLRSGLSSTGGGVALVLDEATGDLMAIPAAGFVRLGAEDADDFVALAALVNARFDALKTWLDTHSHAGVVVGAGVTGPPTPSPSAASVAASKVKAR